MATVLSARLVALPEYAASPPTRLTFLYSALAPRKTANPTGFHSALSWWKATLTTLLAAGMFGEDSLVLSANDDLRERLRWDKIGRPSSLGTVIVRPTPLSQLHSYRSSRMSSQPLETSFRSSVIWHEESSRPLGSLCSLRRWSGHSRG